MTSYLTFCLLFFLFCKEGLCLVERNHTNNTSNAKTLSKERLSSIERGKEFRTVDTHLHRPSLYSPLCPRYLSRKDPEYQLCSKYPDLNKKIKRSRKKSHKTPRRTRRRKVHNKSSRCDRLTEISCSMKCVSANKICDGVMDCNDGRDERNCNELQLSLKGGKKKGEGRVEIVMNGFTGSLCGREWTDEDASVFCRMNGYIDGGTAVKARKHGFGKGYGLVWSTKFNCEGNERDLFECPLVKKQLRCSHSHDAAVVCHSQKQRKPKQNSSVAQCGIRQIPQTSFKILGGQLATYGSQPWQARLVVGYNFKHLCGASIIDNKWIVTAAHCLKNLRASDLRVVVGDHSVTQKDAMEQVFKVKSAIPHPMYKSSDEETNYDYYFHDPFPYISFFPFKNTAQSKWGRTPSVSSYNYDIALLKLDSYKRYAPSEITFNKYVSPICLPSENTPYTTGLNCEVSGWGYNGKSKKGSSKIKVAKLSLIKHSTCKRKYGPIFYDKITSQMVCAGSIKGEDTCQGDSGGPLACKVNGVFTLMGVTSWGYECSESTAPGIYTKVGGLRKWIDQTREKY